MSETTKTTGELNKTVFDAWMDFNVNMMKKSMEISKECWGADSFDNFYKAWSGNASEMFDKIMRNPEFTEKSWEMFKQTSGVARYFEELTKANLKMMNVPTMDQIDELHERLNYLDDKLESLEEKIDKMAESKAKSEVKASTKTTAKTKTKSN